MPTDLRNALDTSTLLPGPPAERIMDVTDVAQIRQAIRDETFVVLDPDQHRLRVFAPLSESPV